MKADAVLLVNNNSSQTHFNGQIKHVKYGFRYQITSKYKKNPNYNPQVQNKWGTMGGGERGGHPLHYNFAIGW